MTQQLDATFTLIDTFDEATEFMSWLGERHASIIAVDTETTGLRYWEDTIRTIQVGDAHRGWVMRMDRWGGLFDEFMQRYDGSVAMHNAKFDLEFLKVAGWEFEPHRIEDTRTLAHLERSDLRSGLKPVADRIVGPWASAGQKILDKYKHAHGWDWATVPVDLQAYWSYGALDTVLTARIYEELAPVIKRRHAEEYDIEIQVLFVLMEMEMKGIKVDLEYASSKQKQLLDWAGECRDWAYNKYGIDNLTSGAQVIDELKLGGWEPTVFTPTGKASSAKDVMESIDHPLAKAHVAVKHSEKMANTYFENFASWSNEDGYVHCKINPIGARTGRMSVSEPNLQNLPRTQLIRGAFIPSEGNKLLLIDYDQMEVRLAAHFSGDKNLNRLIETSDDIHTTAAQMLYDLGDELPTKAQRQLTKNTTYGVIYGGGAQALSNAAGVDIDESRRFISMYKSMFPGIPRLQKKLEKEAAGNVVDGLTYVTSSSGRRHYAHMDKAYRFINYKIQGEGAHVLKKKLVELDNAGFGEYMVVPIHDEVASDVPADDAEEIAKEMCAVMTDHGYSTTLTVASSIVERWGDKYAEAS